MARLELVPKHAFSWDFDVLDGERRITHLDLAALSEKARFELGGTAYGIRREGIRRGPWLLEREEDGRVLARGEKVSAFRREYEVTAGDRRFSYRPRHVLSRAFVLRHGRQEMGSVAPAGFLRRRAVAEFAELVPEPTRIFLAFLAIILWRRHQRAAAGGG